ncbi:MAG: mandelate racemase/muconate lactonizing enzyme family protein [Propioniciclava sp.]
MKISQVEVMALGVPLDEPLRWGAMEVHTKGGVIVRISTDEGVTGIGEAGFSAEYYPTVAPAITHQLAPLLIGENPLAIRHLWEKMHAATHIWGRRGIETYALSGVDTALWDIAGKVANLPIHTMLGSDKEQVPAYFAPSLKPASAIVTEALTAVRDGYHAIKLRGGRGIDVDVDLVAQVAEAVDGCLTLCMDANMSYNRRDALTLAHRLEEFGVYWLEEPIACHSLEQYALDHAWLNERVGINLAGGESLFTRHEYIGLFNPRAFDILQPDAVSVGGISEAKRVADLASAWNIKCIPHIACSSGTGIGMAAGLQVILASPNAELMEVDAYGGPAWDGLLKQPLQLRDGDVVAPTAPGLGVELADDAEERFGLTTTVQAT